MSGALRSGLSPAPPSAGTVRPPLLATALLRAVLPAGMTRESVLGDLQEEFVALRRLSLSRASLWYWREALGVARRALRTRVSRTARGAARSPAGEPAIFAAPGDDAPPPKRPPIGARLARRIEALFGSDIPYALRNLMSAPGFTAVAVLSLALGIAPLAAVGGFLNAMFLRPPVHVQQPERLVALFRAVGATISWPDLADAAQQADGLVDVAAFNTNNGFNLTDDDITRTVMGAEVSTNFFAVTGVPLLMGREFAAGEMGSGAEPVVIISHTFWQVRFDGSREVLGETLRINGRDHTVIGVAPEGLLSLEMPAEPDIWVPLRPLEVENRGYRGLYGVGRLADGATLADVHAQLVVVQDRLREAYPRYWRAEGNDPAEFGVHPLRALRLRPGDEGAIAAAVAMILVLGLLVLITACANLGNLLLARGWQRGGEIAVRLALGANRSTLIVMLLTESVLLGCSGGALAALSAHWLTQALKAGLIGPGIRLDLGVDWRVLAFTAMVSIATGVLFGLVPALRASSPQLTEALKGEQRDNGPGRALSFRNLLVTGQVAASLALLISAGVLLRSVQAMRSIDPGFEPAGALTVELDLNQRAYSEVAGRQFFEQLLARVAEVPDVQSTALAVDLPLNGDTWMNSVIPEGVEPPEDGYFLVQENRVSAGYFEVMGMPLLRGRSFTDDDGGDVIVVNAAFAQRFFPDAPGGVLGKRVSVGEGGPAQIVGVVRDAKYGSLGEASAPPHFWRSWKAVYTPAAHLVVRANGDPRELVATLRRLVREADRDLPVLEPRLLDDVVGASSEEQRVASTLLALIGVVSLTLAVVGIYGVLSFVVSRRTAEVGVRVALGARRADVIRLVLAQGLRLILAGVAMGLALAFAIVQVLAAAFPGVEALDPLAPTGAVLLLILCAAVATLAPALRASRVDPMVALRAE